MLPEVIRHAARRLRRSPGYSIPVVLSLALGIGLNTAVFALVSNVLLRPLPFPNQAELVTVGEMMHGPDDPPGPKAPNWHVYPPNDVIAWRNDSRVFTSAAVFVEQYETVEGAAGPEYVAGGGGSANLLNVLGTRVLRGRWFAPQEEGTHYVVISSDLWQRQFAGDPAIVGRTLRIRNEVWTIIGVLSHGDGLPLGAQFWLPATYFGGQLVARPKPGLSLASIARELETIAPGVANMRKGGYTVQVVVEPLHDQIFGAAGPSLQFVTAAAALLLLIACANIANLSLARSLEQRRETAVRIALGASRLSLAGLILAENFLLAVVGAVTGGLLAVWGIRILVAIGSDDVMRVSGINVDLRSVAFAGTVAVVTALMVSLGPMLAATNRDVRPALGQNTRQGGSNAFRGIRRTLVAAQLALTLLLMTGAGLLIRSVGRLTRPDHLGFSPHGVVLTSISLFGGRYQDSTVREAFERNLIDRIKALPFVQSVGLGPPPLVGGRADGLREGFNVLWYYRDTVRASPMQTVWMKFIDEGYLDTYRIHLIAGRMFRQSDDSAAPVALLNGAATKLFFKDRPALDQQLTVRLPGRDGRMNRTPLRVVGIVGDVLQRDLAIETAPEIYIPQRQKSPSWALNIAIRTTVSSAATIGAIRQTIRAADPHVSASRLESMDDIVTASLARHTFLLWLLSVLAGLGVALSVLGLYAIVSYLVAQRTFEIGLRIALGAQRHNILGLVLGEAGMLVGIGLLIGIPAALGLSRFISSFLYEVKPHDVITFAAAPLLLAIVALAAAYRPARRAATLDPAQTLRAD